MSILSKKDFSALCGMPTNQLSVYIKRGKVFVSDGDLINTNHEVNALFLQKQKNKNPTPLLNLSDNIAKTAEANTSAPVKVTIPGIGEVEIPDYAESEKALKYFDTLKRDKEVALLELKQAKLRGEVVPAVVIQDVFTRHNHAVLTAMKPAMEQIIDKMAKMHDIASADVATYKGEIVNALNIAITTAAHASAASVEQTIKEYSETKGVGERH